MGKSLARVCKTCKTELRSNFVRHAKLCGKKNGMKWEGWKFLNRDGNPVAAQNLPYRPGRMMGTKDGVCVQSSTKEYVADPDAKAWRKVKRNSVVTGLNPNTRLRAFRQFVRLLLRDKRITIKKLREKLEEANDTTE